ncbi:MAG: polymer-forming cytoskeletal protein [Oxalobacteraceae bacterium]|nr:polymer-forming cytoskeletal protein [Oxalobacteraceae bacterium]
MADTNPPGSLLVGDGVYMKGTMNVPGIASVDGKLEGQLTADVIVIQANGSVDGKTTANHIKVAGTLTDTAVASKTLVVESSGMVSGAVTYAEMEIKKGGSIQGGIYKIGSDIPVKASPVAPPPVAPSSPPAPSPTAEPEAAADDTNPET